MLAAAAALLGTGCSNGPLVPRPTATPTPTPTPTQSEPAEPSRAALSVTAGELRGADPCKLIGKSALAQFGTAEYDRGISYGQCDIVLDDPDGESVSVFVDLQAGASEVDASDPAPVPALLDGVTVYESEGVSELGGGSNCTRDVVVQEDTAAVGIAVYGDRSASRACRIADTAARDVIRLLRSGALPSAHHPPASLANENACDLVEESEAARVPDIDPAVKHDEFAGQSCSWGGRSIEEPQLSVLFQHLDEPAEGRPLTVAGRPAVLVYSPAMGDGLLGPSLPECSVDVEYGEAGPIAEGSTEVVSVGVIGESPRQELCSLAQDLAPKVLARLPGA